MKREVIMKSLKNGLLKEITEEFPLKDCSVSLIEAHEGGRNIAYICEYDGVRKYILRISALADREKADYEAEAEFVRYLSENGASVANVVLSNSGNAVSTFMADGEKVYAVLFDYAKGILICDNGYKYREGVPLSEYFFNTGKTLGKIHALSKKYVPQTRCSDYFHHYNKTYIDSLIPNKYYALKSKIIELLSEFEKLERTPRNYGLVHFDFSDGNYHIDYANGNITVFDFDNCCYAWYMFDLANLWTHGVGWIAWENDVEKRRAFMTDYFDTIIKGYRSETDIDDASLSMLPLFINMVLIENIVDEFECCRQEDEQLDYEDIEDAAECLTEGIPYEGFFGRE